jgi:hypothetical protein
MVMLIFSQKGNKEVNHYLREDSSEKATKKNPGLSQFQTGQRDLVVHTFPPSEIG